MLKVNNLPVKVYDLETKFLAQEVPGEWRNVEGFQLASCVVYYSKTDQYYFFGSDQTEQVCNFLTGNQHIVISYNGVNFDSKVLLGNDRYIQNHKVGNEKYSWNEMDLFLEIYRRIIEARMGLKNTLYEQILQIVHEDKERKIRGNSGCYKLGSVCNNTIGLAKNDESENGPKYYKMNRFDKLFQYNLQDVRLTKSLLEFIQTHRYIVNGEYDIVKF